MSRSRPSFPRSGLILAILLPLAVLVLWWLAQRDQADPFTLGGPLLPWTPEQVESLTLTRGGAQYRIERNADGDWLLSGGVVDFADGQRVEKLLADLAAARGGPLLPGSEPMDRRYEFNGSGAIRLAVFGPDAEAWRLALGAVNPVTGFVYASGAGRSASFPVEMSLRKKLAELPDEIRTSTLLPAFPLSSVERLTIGGAVGLALRRDGEGWWLRWNPDERAGPGGVAADYLRFYDDRRRTEAAERWLRADDDAISLLLFEATSLVVRRFVPPGDAAPNLEDWGLEPPYRSVVMEGPKLQAGPVEKRIRIDFGSSLDGEVVAARRLENVLLTDDLALKRLELRAVDLLNLEVLPFPVVQADSIDIAVAGRRVLAGHRDAEAYRRELTARKEDRDRVDGRRAWRVDFPTPGPSPDPDAMDVRLQTTVVSLDRLPILAAFGPQAEPDALAPDRRVRIVIERERAGKRTEEELVVGSLLAGRLPAGSPPPAPDPEGGAPAAVWRPATGQLLQVPASFLTTLRNLAL